MSSYHFLILDLITTKVLLGGRRRENANIRTVAWVGDLATVWGIILKERDFRCAEDDTRVSKMVQHTLSQ